MTFLILLASLALGYYRPLTRGDMLRQLFAPYANLLERNFNDGQPRHGVIAWLLAVLLPALLVAAADVFLARLNGLISLGFGIAVLYLVLKLGRFGVMPERIAAKLRAGQLDEARALLGSWQECDAQAYSTEQVARVAIESTLRHAHYALFAPVFWFVLIGPAGALLYRLAHLTQSAWAAAMPGFGDFARRAFEVLEWLPARLSATCFAVVGDFEDAVYCWRTQAALWPNPALGIVLASGAGALGVRLGSPRPCGGALEFRPELGLGDEADADYLQSSTGLVWRVLALLLGLLLLLTFAHWLGD